MLFKLGVTLIIISVKLIIKILQNFIDTLKFFKFHLLLNLIVINIVIKGLI